MSIRNDRFLKACRLEPTDVTPVWLMRQAGRALPKYRKLREGHGFLELMSRPDLMAEVTVMPLTYFEADAAILFADIMLPLSCLGIPFDIVEGRGPVLQEPVTSHEQIRKMADAPIAEGLPALVPAIGTTLDLLDGRVPLIGFAGAPFTLASYMVEGGPSRSFTATKALMHSEPEAWEALMSRISSKLIEYLDAQITAGVHAVQLFDSWVGALSPEDYRDRVHPWTRKVLGAVGDRVPRIHFGTGNSGMLKTFSEVDAEVIGLDWRVNLDEAWEMIGTNKAVQGNLDPALLLASEDAVVRGAHRVLDRAGGRRGHVFNLGHGVLPETPVEHLQLLVETVHRWEPGERP